MAQMEEEEELEPEYLEKIENIISYVNDYVKKLMGPIDLIKIPKEEYLKFYNLIYAVGSKRLGAVKLYEYYQKLMEDNSKELSKKLNDRPDSEIVDIFINVANKMDNLIFSLYKTFLFLDAFYTDIKKKPRLLECAIEKFKSNIFLPIQSQLTKEVNKLLEEDRNGNRENRTKIQRIFGAMKTMDLTRPKDVKMVNGKVIWIKKGEEEENAPTPIQDFWFNEFMKDTEQFASSKAIRDIQNRSTPEYVLIELKFLEEEKERQSLFMNKKYFEKLNSIIYREIIGKNMVDLVDMEKTGVNNMLVEKKNDQLENLYNLFQFYEPSLSEVSRVFLEYIKTRGDELTRNKELVKNPKTFIPQLLSFHKEIISLVKKCFKDNSKLQEAKARGFKEFTKDEVYPKLLALYVDHCMRVGFKGKDNKKVKDELDDIIELLRDMTDKDVFSEKSNNLMSKRLIDNSSLSKYNEEIFITKLSKEGSSYVKKMKEMKKDIDQNNKEKEYYKNSESKGMPGEIKFEVLNIRQNAWSINQKDITTFNLPKIFSNCIEDYEQFYSKMHNERKLLWCLKFSKLEIKYLYLKDKNISISTLPQVLILLELEKNKTLSVEKLAGNLSCKNSVIKESIDGLIYNISYNPKKENDKGVIISTTSNSNEFNDNDEFKINENFKSLRVKFNTIPGQKKMTKEEEEKEERVNEEIIRNSRNHIIRATLTRIMKSKIGQEATHEWLVSETARQIYRFQAQPDMIKYNIENLIQINVIKRSEKKVGCYEYVA